MREKRSRKEKNRDRQQHYDELESYEPDPKAAQRFKRPPYQSIDVAEYLAKKYGIRGGWENEINCLQKHGM